ncbi:hypothetical protein K458DRAFT_63191 [Lentithecium fluviatile CBS 122367]|uniref:Heterokaryon incompatibility domain-containing protein n=1 Tax=Lentithecium fluviatile CBS 122367 TaxID=1168545 RepID=A0A6G1JKX4_9PLEO|nr:hypothetical protein K458DRAFT_63191 [Lentithecium fluviatile CBS 122367]
MTSATYHYTPLLSESSFRVFRLLTPQPGLVVPDIIEIELYEADLDTATPEFEAISYAWGQEEADATIICNGLPFLVTPNVVSVLKALLHRPESLRVLWLDSICIDQSSIPERNIQVPRMRSIYRQATKVWVWLGEGSLEVNLAFEFLHEVTRGLEHLKECDYVFTSEIWEEPRKLFHARICETRGYHDPVDTNFIVDLLNLPWFQRTWTVQELVLAREAVFLLGTKSIRWKLFTYALFHLQDVENYSLQITRTSVSNPASFYDDLRCYLRIDSLWHNDYRDSPMSQSLKLVRTKKSTNPRDKVYGLYGLFDHIRIPRLPQVDYTKPVQQIYSEITRVAVEVDNSLEILEELRLPPRIPDLPSWVPDWSNPDYVNSAPPIVAFPLATGESKAKWEFHQSELATPGTVIDEIEEIAPSSSISSPGFRRGYNARQKDLGGPLQRRLATIELVRTLQAWTRCSRRIKSYPTGYYRESPKHAFFETIKTEKLPYFSTSEKACEAAPQGFEDFVSILMANDPANHIDLATIHDIVRPMPEYTAIRNDFVAIFGCSTRVEEWSDEMKIRLFLKVYSPEVALIQHEVALNTYHRTFFTTRDGYMGMGPRWSEPGDCVALIAGLCLPFIARREGSKYRLIGPANIHGIMRGERWDENQIKTMTFV